ncbi:MAG TPA: hypothetical protein VF297_14070 [Pyrinomonadaceae bacterium]
MLFEYAYRGSSAVVSTADRTSMSFAPDVTRDPTFFTGRLRQRIEFREAISALHDVVVSDLRFKPKDKTAYKEWAARQEQIDWQALASERTEVAGRVKELQAELNDLHARSSHRMGPFNKARKDYYNYIVEKEDSFWRILFDPVITVHPDELFFECFSQDESSYGRLGAGYEVFEHVGEFACGTTNIDYSAALYDEFQKIRTYKETRFEIDPSGFDVRTTGEAEYREKKIDLPDSWVRGFLQVSSAMSLPARTFDLHPMDIHNICFVLRRRREQKGPRAMRYHLTPGEPVRVVFEPWETEVVCPRSIYAGADAEVIRVWGRRRIHILERLIPVARKFTVHLLGTGLPSFYVADLGDMSFTLGLSGWTTNDWSRAGNFDLLAPRMEVDELTKRVVFDELRSDWRATPDELASRLHLDRATVLGALGAYTQAGRAIFDLNKRVYRARELSREPLPVERLRFASEREESASRFLSEQAVALVAAEPNPEGQLSLRGAVKDKEKTFHPSLRLDADGRMVHAECTCNWHQQHKLFKGPCEHILALRMEAARRQRQL